MKETDFEFQWFSGTGKGGQHRNKHQNCCRCIHISTGISANGTNSRSREDNKRAAMTTCIARVQAYFFRDKERGLAGTERIRTYHECDNRVIDHASGMVVTFSDVFSKTDGLEELIFARAKKVR